MSVTYGALTLLADPVYNMCYTDTKKKEIRTQSYLYYHIYKVYGFRTRFAIENEWKKESARRLKQTAHYAVCAR